jgi:hypothetical protein
VIGAPSWFPTLWGWLNKWFDQNTVSKICIVPRGKELETLSEAIDPAHIPRKYGGQHEFEFGMPPELDDELKALVTWVGEEKEAKELPLGPMRWVNTVEGGRSAIAVGSEQKVQRKKAVLALGSPAADTS